MLAVACSAGLAAKAQPVVIVHVFLPHIQSGAGLNRHHYYLRFYIAGAGRGRPKVHLRTACVTLAYWRQKNEPCRCSILNPKTL
tara:strand:- start:2376 stop:2627 length:252 start_codon:yes stop_codon:yes gene_type:complete